MPGPLDGVKVVEFTEIIAGPFAGMLLSDMGADVIKVEPPWGDPWRGTQPISPTESRVFIAYNRGKRSITLDLTTDAAREVLARLIPQMDVAIVNYRPDVAAKLGVDYDSLSALNPQSHLLREYRLRPAGPGLLPPGLRPHPPGHVRHHDRREQDEQRGSRPRRFIARGGHLGRNLPGLVRLRRPVPPGANGKGPEGGDHPAGDGHCVAGNALRRGGGSGQGNKFEETLESLAALREAGMPYDELLKIYESDHPVSPGNIYYRSYQTADGVISLGCLSDPLRQRLLNTLGLTDIRFDPGYDPRSEKAAAYGEKLIRQAEEAFLERSAAEWLALLDERGIPAGPVRFIEEVFDDPQVQANDLVSELEHRDVGPLRMVGPLAKFSETPLEATHPPALGQHTGEVLAQLGFGEAEIQEWREQGALG